MSRPTSIDLRSRAASAAAGVPDIPSGDIATPALRSILQSLAKRESGSTETVRVVERAAGGGTDASTAYLLSRENHTGTQSPATIEGLEALIRAIAQQALVLPRWNVRSLTASDTAEVNDWCDVDATAGACTITLPPAVDSVGELIYVRKTDSSGNAVIVDGDGAETINGAATRSLTVQYATVTLGSNGTEWCVL